MQNISKRLASLFYLSRPLAFLFVGILMLSLGVAQLILWAYTNIPVPGFFYYLTLQFLPDIVRGGLFLALGLAFLVTSVWSLRGLVIFPIHGDEERRGELVLGYKRFSGSPNIAVLSGGAGMLILASLGEHAKRLTCITPVQEPVEYYYRASGLFHFQNVYYVVPSPVAARIYAHLDDGTITNVMHVDQNLELAARHVEELELVVTNGEKEAITKGMPGSADYNHVGEVPPSGAPSLALTRLAYETLRDADAIILGPGSLFESILPNLLIKDLRETVQQSSALKIYICNLMTEPGLTTGFSVGDHIRQIKRYGGFVPDYVLLNAQRIESEVTRLYAAAHQMPVYLEPDAYEETTVLAGQEFAQQRVVIEGSVVIEADLASSVVQYTASIDSPGESRAVRVLRHDPQKLTAAILELLRQV